MPLRPRSVHASVQTSTVRVHWSAPSSTGGAPITEYIVTSHPSGRTCTTSSTECTITGLRSTASYTFTVVAKNKNGVSASATSNAVTLAATSASAHLTVSPSTGLTNGVTVKVTGSGFVPNDQVFVVQCLRSAKGQSGCAIATATSVTISANGVLPRTSFRVVTGAVGTATCGTRASDLAACALSAGNASGTDTATAPITFALGTTTTSKGTPSTVKRSTTTTRPAGPATTRPTTTTTSTGVAFSGTYHGTMKVLIVNSGSSASATISGIQGTGTSSVLGASTLNASGQVPSTATNSNFSFTGVGTISSSQGSLALEVVSSSANAPEGAGTVTLHGTAKVTQGTGKFAGASGTLKFSGSFDITGVDSGTQTPSFTGTISGTLKL
ncbi:MAG TPA: fibronectin type III domain-containing protein [Acidimicrobiales bacterium]|nr:fibronectin type III domain-containing protein [Acidimicrobiales bacterium]